MDANKDGMKKRVKSMMITGATGEVGSYAALFAARLGIADTIYVVARNQANLATISYNAQTSSLMRGYPSIVEPVGMDLSNVEETAETLRRLSPDLLINCATGMSLYPYFPAMKKRQKRMGLIPGFAHTLPKDMVVLYPLMQAVHQAAPRCRVVNLSAPDLAGPVLYPRGLAPTIGAGTLDSTSQGIALRVAKELGAAPNEIVIRLVAHHALRRFPAHEVPFILKIYYGERDITEDFTEEERFGFVNYATDVTGVETMNAPVSNNASITAASAVETAYALVCDEGTVRHGSGILGIPGGAPVRLLWDRQELALPEGVSTAEAFEVNTAGMKKDGLDYVKEDGTAVFTEAEQYWIRESLGLGWKECAPENCAEMTKELKAAYQKMALEEGAAADN